MLKSSIMSLGLYEEYDAQNREDCRYRTTKRGKTEDLVTKRFTIIAICKHYPIKCYHCFLLLNVKRLIQARCFCHFVYLKR